MGGVGFIWVRDVGQQRGFRKVWEGVSPFLCLPLSLSVCLSLSLSIDVCECVCVCVCLTLSLPPSLSIFPSYTTLFQDIALHK